MEYCFGCEPRYKVEAVLETTVINSANQTRVVWICLDCKEGEIKAGSFLQKIGRLERIEKKYEELKKSLNYIRIIYNGTNNM